MHYILNLMVNKIFYDKLDSIPRGVTDNVSDFI